MSTLTIPATLKWDAELDAWVASAKSLCLTETGCTQDLAEFAPPAEGTEQTNDEEVETDA